MNSIQKVFSPLTDFLRSNMANAAGEQGAEQLVVKGDGKVHVINPAAYITNPAEGQTGVEAGRAWQITLEVENTATGSDSIPCGNKWGFCLLASTPNPFDNFYYNHFQLYQHASNHPLGRSNTLTFKSSTTGDYEIAGRISMLHRSYRIRINYDGQRTYSLRTELLTEQGYMHICTDAWVTPRVQNEITQLSSALPTGINIRKLAITLGEEGELLENTDYAIRNAATGMYLSRDAASGTIICHPMPAEALRWQAELEDEQMLHNGKQKRLMHLQADVINSVTQSYEKRYLTAEGALTSAREERGTFIYSEGRILPVFGSSEGYRTGEAKTDGNLNDQWKFDLMASFTVRVKGLRGGALINRGTELIEGKQIMLPCNAPIERISNKSVAGYQAELIKDKNEICVVYKAILEGLYIITDKRNGRSETFEWKEGELTTYPAGEPVAWSEMGNSALYRIVDASQMNISMQPATIGADAYRLGASQSDAYTIHLNKGRERLLAATAATAILLTGPQIGTAFCVGSNGDASTATTCSWQQAPAQTMQTAMINE